MERLTTGQLLKQINDALEKRVNNHLRVSGLTMSQSWALMCLSAADRGILPLKALEKALGVAQPTCQGIVRRMEMKGLVTSFQSDEDRRIKLVSITEEGLEAARKAEEDVEELQASILSGLTEDEKAMFHSLLSKIFVNVKK